LRDGGCGNCNLDGKVRAEKNLDQGTLQRSEDQRAKDK